MKYIRTKEILCKPSSYFFGFALFASLIVQQICILFSIYYGVTAKASLHAIFLLCTYWVYICDVFSIIVYLCLADSHRQDVDETIAAYKGERYYQRFGIKYFVFGAVILQIFLLGLYWFAFRNMEHFADLFPALFTMYLCNIFLPLIICLLAASFFACLEQSNPGRYRSDYLSGFVKSFIRNYCEWRQSERQDRSSHLRGSPRIWLFL